LEISESYLNVRMYECAIVPNHLIHPLLKNELKVLEDAKLSNH